MNIGKTILIVAGKILISYAVYKVTIKLLEKEVDRLNKKNPVGKKGVPLNQNEYQVV